MRRRRLQGWSSLALVCFVGCAAGDSGSEQAFRIKSGQFFEGTLPGFLPTGKTERTPRVTSFETANLTVRQGQGGKAFSGRADRDTSSVGIALDGVGSGYWVVPVGSVDTTTSELSWSASADFGQHILPGRYALRVVAIDGAGVAGDQLVQDLCVAGRVPDNGRSCSDSAEPPRVVVSLQWDSNADLDLEIVAPSGARLGAKHTAVDGDEADAAAYLDRDSNSACVIDGIRTENLVWNDESPVGKYHVYVNLFDACKQPSVRFSIDVYTAEDPENGDASYLVRRMRRTGELLDLAADPRATNPLFITDLTFN
jgi:hypothetical protein